MILPLVIILSILQSHFTYQLEPTENDKKPQQPHYTDGKHNNDFEEDFDSLSSHTCEELIKQFGAHFGGRPAIYENSTIFNSYSKQLFQELDEILNPDDCSSARLLLYSPHECGLGAELHWVTVALTIAYVTKRALVFREDLPWIYAERPFCADGQGTYSCYFRSLSKCTIRDASQYAALVDESAATGGIPTLVTTALDAHRDTRVVQYTDKLNEQLDFQFTRKVPDPWHMKLQSLRNGPSSLFWWRSQLLGYMWRFQPRVQRLFDERRRATLPPSLLHAGAPLIGMHSRSGDKVYGSGLQPAEMARIDAGRKLAFLNAAARQCATHLEPGAHAFAAAYVATKDPAVLAAAQRAAGDGQLDAVQLIWDASVHRYGQGFSTEDLVDGTLNGTREALDAMFDVEMLASCAAFVGTFESNLSRLVMEIGAYRYNFVFRPLGVGKQNWWVAFP